MSIGSPSYIRITLGDHLPEHSTLWFDGLNITNMPNGHAVVHGMVADQSALFGILLRIRDLGIHLLSLEQGSPEKMGRQQPRP